MLSAKINKIIKFSNVDGPGNRMAIFFQKCNFNCEYCHNPETIKECINCKKCIEVCESKALSEENEIICWDNKKCCDCDQCIKTCPIDSSPKTIKYSITDLLQEIERVKFFIKGITVSGGESSLNFEFITALFKKVKELWPHLDCFVDTNGGVDFQLEVYKEFVETTDAFMLDIKAWDLEEHRALTGVSNENVIKNLIYLKSINKLFEVRTVVVKDVLNNALTVKNVSKIISDGAIRYKIIKYRSFGVRLDRAEKLRSPSKEELMELEKLAKSLNVKSTLII
ncbi:YjjW family glycine radical enzyme activase [uncultured Cetobacterium sp.]|uniref:YjjW family glycine radical enzyme activase n=1 Tax=uncultured Cetobacterium sp. TaxID=527638 RepID=UPI002619B8D4|nr:YjjW family glycine radical enzyme activase [uncultured Cetobacterium sp.]